MIRPATVTKVHDDPLGFVDVVSGKLKLEQIPVYTTHNERDVVQWLPTVNEDGTIFSAGGDLANAFFTAAIPTKKQNIKKVGNPQNTIGVILKDSSKIRIEQNDGVTIETPNELSISTENQKLEQKISNIVYHQLTQFLANIMGAQFFTSGLTNLICSVGPISFPPTPIPVTPPSPPNPPVGSEPTGTGDEQKVTKIPAQEIDNIDIRNGSIRMNWSLESMNIEILPTPTIPVVTPGGPGTITPGTYPIRLTGDVTVELTDGDLDITFPAKPIG